MRKTNVVICGAEGRMGQLLVACAKEDPTLEIVGTVDSGDDLDAVIENADVVIDFTTHEATLPLAKITAAHRKALVIGTTGHSQEEHEAIMRATLDIALVWSSNFSTGINILFYATRLIGETIKDADIEISETHHTKKKDAPSGTAKTLRNILRGIRNTEIPVRSHRIGDVVGDHSVTFTTPEEQLTLSHHAIDRATFARGALRAAKWVVGKSPGIYSMQNVLGLEK
jgi:4-hydroxy-tetrahydrodipicolinate reductase